MNSPRNRVGGVAMTLTALTALAAVTLLAAGCARAPDLDTVRLYDDATRRLIAAESPEQFLQAAALFEQVLERGGENGSVLHGLGNAWFQSGRKGAAIAAWRRALVHRPRDPYLRANLAQALGRDPENEPRSLGRTLLFWQDDLSYGEKAWLLTGSVAIACLLFGLARIGQFARIARDGARSRVRSTAAPLGLLAGLVALLAAISFAVEVRDREFTVHGVVAAPELVARKGNAESFDPAFTEPLREGSEFVVLDRRGEWLFVRVAKDLEGWVPADRVVTW